MIYVILGTGFEETEALGPVDCMRRAGLEVCTLGIGGELIVSAHAIPVKADKVLENLTAQEIDQAELVLVPGGLGGVAAIKGSEQAMSLIRYAADHDRWVAAICAGPTVPGGIGLLKGRRATCFPTMEDGMIGALDCRGSQVEVDGKFITGEAAGSTLEFGLTIVEKLAGREKAEQVANAIHFHGKF